MKKHTTQPDSATHVAETSPQLFDDWFDPIEFGVRSRVRDFIETMMEEELDAVLSRPRYGRIAPDAGKEASTAEGGVTGHRHGHRSRSLLGTFGPVEVAMPRARLNTPNGGTTEWKSKALKAYQRRTIAADAVIAATYLAGTNTRRVRRALTALFGGAVSKDTVSRTWRKVKTDWDAWNTRSLADEPIVRLILDGTVVRVRLDRKATSISLLVVLGVRADGQKVLLTIKNMGGESAEAWRSVLDDLTRRGLQRPEFLIVDGAAGLDSACVARLTSPEPGVYERSRVGELLRCGWHGWEFDMRNGQSWFDPKRFKVRTYPVVIEDGETLAKGPYVAETFPVHIEDSYVIVET